MLFTLNFFKFDYRSHKYLISIIEFDRKCLVTKDSLVSNFRSIILQIKDLGKEGKEGIIDIINFLQNHFSLSRIIILFIRK